MSSGETVLFCSLLVSAVPEGAVRPVGASLSSSRSSNHVIQRRRGKRAPVPGLCASSLLCSAQDLQPQEKPSCPVSVDPPSKVQKQPRSFTTALCCPHLQARSCSSPGPCEDRNYCSFSCCTSWLDLKKSLRSKRYKRMMFMGVMIAMPTVPTAYVAGGTLPRLRKSQ